MTTEALTITREIHFGVQRKGRQEILPGPPPTDQVSPNGRIPRVSRLMALAIHLDEIVRSGEVGGQAELARLGHVTRARITQIMNLLHLAPDIQEELLFLPRTVSGSDVMPERLLRPLVAMVGWHQQREAWRSLASQSGSAIPST